MTYGIEREDAFALLKEHVKNPNMIKHCLATEAVMRALAGCLGEDPVKWGLTGLLHDLDVEMVNHDLSKHTFEAERILREIGVDEEIIKAVKMHNAKAHGENRAEKFHHALAAGETMTGLITAATLVYPDKKIKNVKTKSIKKRMKEKSFAAGVNRDTIMECEKLGMNLGEFAHVCLEAMQGISDELGL